MQAEKGWRPEDVEKTLYGEDDQPAGIVLIEPCRGQRNADHHVETRPDRCENPVGWIEERFVQRLVPLARCVGVTAECTDGNAGDNEESKGQYFTHGG
ncbi:hypothetical protein D3C87_1788440 [compost metagenome]